MSDYRRVDAERPWAAVVSYSRAVRRGNLVEVGGTSATLADGTVVCPGDPYGQTKHILAEVEAALMTLRGVSDACVLGVDDTEWGQRVVALVTPEDLGVTSDPGVLAARIREESAKKLARFKVPREVRFASEIPRGRGGKLDRSAAIIAFSRAPSV